MNQQDLLRRGALRGWPLILLVGLGVASRAIGVSADQGESAAPYVPTPQNIVNEMLEMADVAEEDVVYDLGCGDGRIVITAAEKYGARGVGVDINPERIRESRENAKEVGVTERVEFRQQDLFETDLQEATVVTLYLLPDAMRDLRPKLLEELDPGTRIVSHSFDLDEWQADRKKRVVKEDGILKSYPSEFPDFEADFNLELDESSRSSPFADWPDDLDFSGQWKATLHYWVVPADVEGTWEWSLTHPNGQERRYQLRLDQEFQHLEGVARRDRGEPIKIQNGQVQGERVRWRLDLGAGTNFESLRFLGKLDREAGVIRGAAHMVDGQSSRKVDWEARQIDE